MSDFQDYLDKCTFCTDSFMSYAFDGDTELATTLIQVLLNRDDLVALSCEAQKTAVSLNKESTFDILAQDKKGNLYDIEIQNRIQNNEIKRARYYSSALNTKSLNKGSDYNHLKENYVIFLLQGPVFKENEKPIYHFIMKEIENDKVLEDGRHILFVNLNYKFRYELDDKMNDLKYLFNDLNESEPDKIWYTSFRNKMNLIKNTEGGRSKMELKYNSIFLKGKEQGLSQGLFQGKEEEKERRTIEIISNGLKKNLSLEMIASIAGISVEEVEQYIKDNHLDHN